MLILSQSASFSIKLLHKNAFLFTVLLSLHNALSTLLLHNALSTLLLYNCILLMYTFFLSLADVMDFLEYEICFHPIYLFFAKLSYTLSLVGHGICDQEYDKYSWVCLHYCLTCLTYASLSHASYCILNRALLYRKDISDNQWTNVFGLNACNLYCLMHACPLEISLWPGLYFEI